VALVEGKVMGTSGKEKTDIQQEKHAPHPSLEHLKKREGTRATAVASRKTCYGQCSACLNVQGGKRRVAGIFKKSKTRSRHNEESTEKKDTKEKTRNQDQIG